MFVNLSEDRNAFIGAVTAIWDQWGEFAVQTGRLPSEAITDLTNAADYYAGQCMSKTLKAFGHNTEFEATETPAQPSTELRGHRKNINEETMNA